MNDKILLPVIIKDWKNSKGDYFVVRKSSLESEQTAYLIINIRTKQPCVIEDNSLAAILAQEMMDAGIQSGSVEEAQALMFALTVHKNQS